MHANLLPVVHQLYLAVEQRLATGYPAFTDKGAVTPPAELCAHRSSSPLGEAISLSMMGSR
jgi:hypothetical protein